MKGCPNRSGLLPSWSATRTQYEPVAQQTDAVEKLWVNDCQLLRNGDLKGKAPLLLRSQSKVISTPQIEVVDLFDIETISGYVIAAPSVEI